MTFKRSASVALSHYPRLAFHGLRCAQLISSIIVSGIMCYFIYYLHKEHYSTPWTFIVLCTISLGTMASLLLTIILYNFTYLSPKFNLLLNGAISAFWILGLGLLSWSMSNTLRKTCNKRTWGNSAAIGVCRDYKTLWAFTFIGTISTLAALALDYHTFTKVPRQGLYRAPIDDKNPMRLKELTIGRPRVPGYEVPQEQGIVSNTAPNVDMDIAYHSRCGYQEAELPGLVDSQNVGGNMGYHNQFFEEQSSPVRHR